MKSLWVALLFFGTISLVAQTSDFRLEVNSLYDEAMVLRKTDPVSARSVIKRALSISLQNDRFRYSQLSYTLGDLFVDVAEYDSAYSYFLDAIRFGEKDDPIVGRAYFGKSYVEFYKGYYDKSLASVIEAEKLARALHDTTGLARAVKMIGGLAETEQDYKKSIRYFEEALALNEAMHDTLNIVRTLNSLATPYCHFKEYERGEEILLRAVELAKKINCIRCLPVSYSQLGVNDFYWGKFERSIEYYQLEQAINRQLGESFNFFYANQNIAESLVELGKLDEALLYNDSALQIALNHKANQLIHDAYKIRYVIHKKKGNPALALASFEKQVQYRDSLFNSEKTAITEDLKASYDTERKERQILELEQENTIKDLEATTARQWQVGLVVFLIFLTVVVGILYNRYQLKQRTAKALDEKNNELQKLNGFKDRMFAVISHDLRNPVDAFSTIIESLSQNLQHASREELKEFLESTLRSAKDLKSLLNNLLEWSLVQIGKLPFNPTPVSIHEVIAESANHLNAMAVSKKVKIHNQVDKEKKVLVDKSMMTIILRNLLSNAVKFSPEGKTVELTAQQSNGTVTISVRDEGVGMKPEESSRLFKMEENTRTIGSSPEKGAGIGLLLCKELVDKNRGTISVKSTPGMGSTFYLELPSA
jgi:signal transduction histidine kinase